MEFKEIPFNQTILKKVAGNDEIEFYNFNLRAESGGRILELKLTREDGSRRVVVLADMGFRIDWREVELRPYFDREARNNEIRRLYEDEHLTQAFLGDLFSITQPSVSLIIKNKQ